MSERLAALGPDQEPVVLVACGSFNPPTRAHLRLFPAGAAAVDGATSATAGVGGGGGGSGDDETSRPRRWAVVGGLMSPVGDGYAKAGLAPAAHRLVMCALAAAAAAGQQASRGAPDAARAAARERVRSARAPVDVGVHGWEAGRPGFTRTLDVLRQISREINGSMDGDDDRQAGGEQGDGDGSSGAAAGAAGARGAGRRGRPPQQQRRRPVRVMLLGGTDLVESMRRPGVWSEPDALLREHGVVCVERPAAQKQQRQQQREEQRAPTAGDSDAPPARPPPPPALEEALRSCVVHAVCDTEAMLGVSSSRAREALRDAIAAAALNGGGGAECGGDGDDRAMARAIGADPRVAELLDACVAGHSVRHRLYCS